MLLHKRSASRSLDEELELYELLDMDAPREEDVDLEIDHTLDSVLHVQQPMLSRCCNALGCVPPSLHQRLWEIPRSDAVADYDGRATYATAPTSHRLVTDWHNTESEAAR